MRRAYRSQARQRSGPVDVGRQRPVPPQCPRQQLPHRGTHRRPARHPDRPAAAPARHRWPAGAPPAPSGCRPAKKNASVSNAAPTSTGTSAKVALPARSTACTHTSRTRIQGTSAPGTGRPRLVRTSACQASSGIARTASSSRTTPLRRSARSSAGGCSAERSMSSCRLSGFGYIGVSTPVRAQSSRLTKASALRAKCPTRWARVQPGSSEGPGQLLVRPVRPRCWSTARCRRASNPAGGSARPGSPGQYGDPDDPARNRMCRQCPVRRMQPCCCPCSPSPSPRR